MAYADQDGMSTNRLVSVVIVLLLHAFLGYALVTGLAYDAVVAIKEKMTVVDVKEEEPPEEEEPPPEPEKQIEPPVVSPPPMVVTVAPPPTVRTVDTPPPAAPIVPTAAPPAPPPPQQVLLLKRSHGVTQATGQTRMTIRRVLCSRSVRVQQGSALLSALMVVSLIAKLRSPAATLILMRQPAPT